jgi:hypothetical protein
MNNHEATRIYDKLAASLSEAGLDWLVSQVAAEIRHGKPEQRKLKVRPSEETEPLLLAVEEEGQKRTTARFVGSAEYTANERLNLLLAAIERATVHVAAMEQDVAQVLARSRSPKAGEAEEVATLAFTFKDEREGATSRESTPERRRQLLPWSRKTDNLIRELREVANAKS